MKMKKIYDLYYRLKCFILSFSKRHCLAKKNAEQLAGMSNYSGYHCPKLKMREAIRQGRYYDAQNIAFDHDRSSRSYQQNCIEHMPLSPEDITNNIAKYKLEGFDEEFKSAGEAWEHLEGNRVGKDHAAALKKKHTFRRVIEESEKDLNAG